MTQTNVAQAVLQGQASRLEPVVVILTSASLQTQGMAMVLSRAMQEQGGQLTILLCDAAGDLAIESYQSPAALAPKGMKPEGLLQQIIDAGAQLSVCALYLPNSAYQEQDLRKGVCVAQPAEMAHMLRCQNSRVISFYCLFEP